MKEQLDRSQDRLSPAEWESFCARVDLELERSRRRSETTLRRWAVSSALAAVLVACAGIVFTLTEKRVEDRHPHRSWTIVSSPEGGIPAGPAGADQVRGTSADLPLPDAYRTTSSGLPGGAFVRTRTDSLSTLAWMPGDSSYTRARAQILAGTLPSPSTIRVEEFVNFFRRDTSAVGPADFRITPDAAPSPLAEAQSAGTSGASYRPGSYGTGMVLLRVGIKARELPKEARGESAEAALRPPAVVARGLSATVAFNPAAVAEYRLLGCEEVPAASVAPARAGDKPTATSAGATVRSGEAMTLLYELKLAARPASAHQASDCVASADQASDRLATVRLSYLLPPDAGGVGLHRLERRILISEILPSFQAAPPRLQCAWAAAEFARILRGPAGARARELQGLLPRVHGLAACLAADADVPDFVTLVERAARLAASTVPSH
jgi:hypothetical protein